MIFSSLSALATLVVMWYAGSAIPVGNYDVDYDNRSVNVTLTATTNTFSNNSVSVVVNNIVDEDTSSVQQINLLSIKYDSTDSTWYYSYNSYNSNIVMYFELLGGGSSTGSFITTYTSPIKYEFMFDGSGNASFTAHTPNDFSYTRLVCHLSLPPTDLYAQNDNSYNTGYNDGLTDGYNNGYSAGKDEGEDIGYRNGFEDAKEEYENSDTYINSIFGGIVTVGLIPIEFLMSVFNFEILGINFTHVISAILSIMVIVILLRIVLGGKAGKE